MKKGLLLLTGALLAGGLVACGGDKPSEKTLGAITGSYDANYVLKVISEKPGEQAFARQVSDKVTYEVDFTEGNLYLHGKRIGKELATAENETYEVLVYKDGDTYKFLNTNMGAAVTLKDEAAAKEKINEYLQKVSFRAGGWIDSSSFTYKDDRTYEHHHFLIDSTTIPLADYDLAGTTTLTDKDGGKEASTELTYVGYRTDAGTSELHKSKEVNPGDPLAATAKVQMDASNRVTGFKIDYNKAWMDMPFGDPAPRLVLTGAREFKANHDAEITKINDIAHSAVKGEMIIKESYGAGTVKVYGSENGKLEPRTELHNGDKVEVDSYITVECTPNEGASIKSVLNNTTSESLIEGKYVFAAETPRNEIKVVFTGGTVPTGKVLFAEGTDPDAFFTEWSLAAFEMNKGPQNMRDVDGNEIELDVNTYGAIKVADGKYANNKTVNDIKVEAKFNGEVITGNGAQGMFPDTANKVSYFFFKMEEAGNYEVTISYKNTQPTGAQATITFPNAFVGCTPTITVIKAQDTNALKNPKAITSGTKADVGKWLCVKPNVAEGITGTVTVAVEGYDPAIVQGGWYCFVLKEGAAKLSISIEGVTSTKALVNVTKNAEHVTNAVLTTFDQKSEVNPPVFEDHTIGEEFTYTAGHFACLKLTLAETVGVKSVKVNGRDTMYIMGQFCFPLSDAGTYDVQIVTTTGAGTLSIKKPQGVQTKAISFTLENGFTPVPAGVTYDSFIFPQEGMMIGITVTPVKGTVVDTVKVNGADTKFSNNQYCFLATEAKAYNVVITTKAAA